MLIEGFQDGWKGSLGLGGFMKSEGRKVYGRAEMALWKLHRLHNTA